LVLGATGKTGRRVAERLAARRVPVRLGSRYAETPFDWDQPNTWAPVLQDVGSVYVTYQPDLAIPGAAETVGDFAAQAADMGVNRLVLLSGRGEEGAQQGEKAVQSVGVDTTIVRSAFFFQNFSESFLLDGVLSGAIVLPAGDVAEPFVDADDIADVAVAALTEDGHTGQVYEVTGPRLLTFGDTATEISRATGHEVTYVSLTPDEYAAAALAEGVPEDTVDMLVELFAEVLDGHNAYLTDGIQRALGRPPRDFSLYAQDTAATGVWSASTT
jgi:uncharacterized protein YbjT (DUF2867 family)